MTIKKNYGLLMYMYMTSNFKLDKSKIYENLIESIEIFIEWFSKAFDQSISENVFILQI